MNKLLLLLTCVAISALSTAQCTDDYDWGEAAFGVSPDPEQGETFDDAVINESYLDIIYLLVPQTANEIDDTFPALPIDSATLNSIVITQDGNTYTPAEFGLELNCNNGGTSVNPCTYIGGQSGCGTLSGSPLLPGEFSVEISATVYATFAGNTIPYPFNYEGYTLTVLTDTSLEEVEKPLAKASISPNPVTTKALIQFSAFSAGNGELKVFTLLGEEKVNRPVDVKPGTNKILINASDLDSGVYLYHLEFEGYKVTKRFIVSK